MARPYVEYTFLDSEGHEAQVRLYPADISSFGAVASFAAALASALQGVSDAHLSRYRLVFPLDYAGGNPAAPDSSVRTVAVLFYRNGDDVSSFRLPSPSPLPTDTHGHYAGVRISRAVVDLSGMLSLLDGLLDGAIDPARRPYGHAFSVGVKVGGEA